MSRDAQAPPFNVQADRAGGEEARDVLSVTSGVGPAHKSRGEMRSAVTVASQPLVAPME